MFSACAEDTNIIVTPPNIAKIFFIPGYPYVGLI